MIFLKGFWLEQHRSINNIIQPALGIRAGGAVFHDDNQGHMTDEADNISP